MLLLAPQLQLAGKARPSILSLHERIVRRHRYGAVLPTSALGCRPCLQIPQALDSQALDSRHCPSIHYCRIILPAATLGRGRTLPSRKSTRCGGPVTCDATQVCSARSSVLTPDTMACSSTFPSCQQEHTIVCSQQGIGTEHRGSGDALGRGGLSVWRCPAGLPKHSSPHIVLTFRLSWCFAGDPQEY